MLMKSENEDMESGVFVETANRIITLFGTISEENCSQIVHSLHVMDCENNDPITFIINSQGGCPEQALAVASTIRILDSEVNTHAVGSCMSAAPWILAAGTGTRTASKTCIFMTHFGEWEVGNKGKDQLEAWMDYRDIMNEVWFQSIAEWTGGLEVFWQELSKDKDHYFNAMKALEYRLIDKVTE